MNMHKWKMSFAFAQEKAVSEFCKKLTKERIEHKVVFDFEKKRIGVLFGYPSKKYDSIIKQLKKCFN